MRALASTLVTALAAAVLAVLPATPAAAEEVYLRPADGVFEIEGHGWGHGHGLSQWGAEGAARKGVTYETILDHYYAGTAQTTQAARTIRVLLAEDDHYDLAVRAVSGLKVRDRATGAVHTLPSGPSRWRIRQTSAGQQVQSYNGAWATWSTGGTSAWTGPMQFEGVSPIRVYFPDGSAREYRGAMRAVRTGTSTINVVNVLSLEHYLLGVVPRESPASFQPEALKAQAIAARSYSSYKMDHVPSTATYDICSTIMCQVYGGMRLVTSGGTVYELEHPNTTAAVNATAGVVRTFEGKAIFAEFSSSNGGWSTQGCCSYLSPRADPWDAVASPHHYWTATLSVAQIERRWPSLGTFKRMRVTRRDGNGEWGGRVKEVVLEGVSDSGAATSIGTTGGGVYSANTWPNSASGLRGSWWRVKPAYNAKVVAKGGGPTLVRPPGKSLARVAVHLQNMGTVTWSASTVHLAVASPAGAVDPFNGSTKPGVFVRNVTTEGATTVAPGEVARFEVPLDAARVAPGTYTASYRLRIGSGALFGPSATWTVGVRAPVFSAGAPAVTAPVWADRTVVVPRNGSIGFNVKVTNTSNFDWPVDGAVQLATSEDRYRDSASAGSTWRSSQVVTPATGVAEVADAPVVKPGQTAVFPVRLHGNGHGVGTAYESFEVKYAGYTWMTGSKVTLRVVRHDPDVSRLAETVSQPSAMRLLAYPGDRKVLTLRLRNVGGSAWPVGDEVVATHDGREDALRTSAWISGVRATALVVNVTDPAATEVAPGQVAEYRVPIDPTNKAAATYREYFRAMVAATGARYGPHAGADVTVAAATMRAEVVRNTRGVTVPRDGTHAYVVDLKNTGNTTWRLHDAVRLSSRSTASGHATWLSPQRPSAIDANLTRPGALFVKPGEVARFHFVLAGNGRAAGTYTETFGAGWEGWRSTGLSIPITFRIV